MEQNIKTVLGSNLTPVLQMEASGRIIVWPFLIIILCILTFLVMALTQKSKMRYGMYKFLSAIRKTHPIVKIIILFFIGISCSISFSIGLILLAIFLIILAKSHETNSKRYKKEIQELQHDYDRLREYAKTSETSSVYIGSYVCEYEGKVCYLSKFMSIYVKNVSPSILNEYSYIEKKEIENDVYFQFPIKRKFSKIEKITIISAVLVYISDKYNDDKIYFDSSIPIGIAAVELKSITNILSDKKQRF